MAVPVVSFVGLSGSGKTTLLEMVIRELKALGYRVAAVKHSHHDVELDRPGKDSWRFGRAGSEVTVASSSHGMVVSSRGDPEFDLAEIVRLIGDRADILLTEGYKSGSAPKIVILPFAGGNDPLNNLKEVLTRVTPGQLLAGVPHFDDETVAQIVELIVERIEGARKSGPNGASHTPEAVLPAEFEELLAESIALHGHLCAGQVLGVRMAMRGCRGLGISRPRNEPKRLIVYVEIDRCAADAIQVVTGCKLGKRTLKFVDYGKLAATFLDLQTGNAIRVAAREDSRARALLHQRNGCTKNEAEIAAYKAMSDEELFDVQRVTVRVPRQDLPGPPIRRVTCEQCGEGVNDLREVSVGGHVLCRACVCGAYYVRTDQGVIGEPAVARLANP